MYLTPKGKGKLLCGVIQPGPPEQGDCLWFAWDSPGMYLLSC